MPLGFADSDEYKAFMSELCCQISARHVEPSIKGFWVILGGSAARMYSEGRFLDADRDAGTYCQITPLTRLPVYDSAHSYVEFSIVLHVPDVSTLVQEMFGKPGRG